MVRFGVSTLQELQSLTHAYDGFTTIEHSSLPPYYKGIFPHECACGAEVILKEETDTQEGYTQLQCCNPYCWVKMSHHFSYFAKSLGFKGFGSAGAYTLYRELHPKLKYISFLSIFLLPIGEIGAVNGPAYATLFEEMRDTLLHTTYQFRDAISALGIPDIGKNCRLFNLVKSPVTLLDSVLKKNTDNLCEMVGINALKTRFYLDVYKFDIVLLMTEIMPHIANTPNKEIHLAITGSVSLNGKRLTRAEFIWECESLLDKDGQQAYKLIETKSASKLEYVVADNRSNSSKYLLGERLGNLITADDFYKVLKSGVESASA